MNFYAEIHDIIKELQKKKSYKNVRFDTFLSILKNSELNCPPVNIPEAHYFLKEINKEKAERSERKKYFAKISILLKYKWAIVPVSVSFCALMVLLYQLYSVVPVKPAGNSGLVVNLAGTASILKQGKKYTLRRGDIVANNEEIITGNNTVVDITYDGILLRVIQNSIVKIINNNLGSHIDLDYSLEKGKLLLYVMKLRQNSKVAVNTPYTRGIVKGTFFSVQTDNNGVIYKVFDGKIKVRNIVNPVFNLDSKIIEELNKTFESKSVIVNKNNYCFVDDNKTMYTLFSNRNIRQKPGSIVAHRLKKISADNNAVLSDAMSFAKTLNEQGYIKAIEEIIDPQLMKQLTYANSFRNWKRSLSSDYVLYDKLSKTLLVIDNNGKIEATDLKRILWQHTIGPLKAKPIAARGIVYILNEKNMLYAINMFSGKILWLQSFSFLKKYVKLHIHNKGILLAYFNDATGKSWLCNLTKTGQLLWKIHFQGEITSAPLIVSNIIFVALQNNLIGVDTITGLKIIKNQFNGKIISINMRNFTLFISTDSGMFYSYNVKKGENNWQYGCMGKIQTSFFDPYAVYVVKENGEVFKFNYDGKILWQISLVGVIKSRPVQDAKNVYVNSHQTMFVIDKNQGHVKWSLVIPPIVTKNIALAPDRIFFVSEKKGLVILKK